MSVSGIAQAAAHAELQHDGWTEVNYHEVEKEFTYGAMGHVRTRITLDSYDGSWTSETTGGSAPEDMIRNWAQTGTDVVTKWPPKIEGVFENWTDLPQGYELFIDGAGLSHAAGELALAPGEDAGGQTSLSNTRLAGDLDNLGLRTGDLNGHYAETFRENYVAQLPSVIANQGALVSLLAVAVHAQADIWDQTTVSLLDIESKAEKAMQASAPSGDGNTGLVAVLSVGGAILAGLAAIPTGGATLPVSIALLGGTASAAGAIISHTTADPPKKVPLGGSHPDKVFSNLETALDDLDLQIEGQERDLVTLLGAGLDLTEVPIERSDVDLRKPGIVDAQSNVLDSQQLLTVDEQTIAKITELWLPTIAGDLRSARNDLTATSSGWRRTGDVGLAPDGAWKEFALLQNAMRRLLANTAGELDGAATSLQAAARIIGLSDDNVNARFEKKAERIITLDL